MRWFLLFYGVVSLLVVACEGPTRDLAHAAPKPSINVVHFEDAFFGMDSLRFKEDLSQLVKKYPSFAPDYFDRILMQSPTKEWPQILAFYKAYLPIYKEVKNAKAAPLATPQIEEALKRFHYFFPDYVLPKNIFYFIGPLETYGNVVTQNGIAIGLQLYLGAASNWYFSEQVQRIYPSYLSRRFAPAYIVVNTLENILNDYQPIALNGQSLITQMIEIGKRQYILEQCLPAVPDSVRMGYTAQQLDALSDNQSDIWTYLSAENRLFSLDPNFIHSMLGEAAYHDLFGANLPGNVGKYMGYTIVRDWMRQQKKADKSDLNKLLKTPAMNIFQEASIDF
jgi:hypothetical protein